MQVATATSFMDVRVVVPLPQPARVGDVLVVAISATDAGATDPFFAGVHDSLGNTFQIIRGIDGGVAQSLWVATAPVTTGGPDELTVELTTLVFGGLAATALEYDGRTVSAARDDGASAGGASAPRGLVTGPAVVTRAPGALVLGVVGCACGATGGPGASVPGGPQPWGLVETLRAPPPGAHAPTATLAPSSQTPWQFTTVALRRP